MRINKIHFSFFIFPNFFSFFSFIYIYEYFRFFNLITMLFSSINILTSSSKVKSYKSTISSLMIFNNKYRNCLIQDRDKIKFIMKFSLSRIKALIKSVHRCLWSKNSLQNIITRYSVPSTLHHSNMRNRILNRNIIREIG